MTPYGDRPPKCACGHSWRRHVESVYRGVAPEFSMACGIPGCYCLTYVAARPRGVPG